MEFWMPYITSAVILATFLIYIGLLGFILTWVYHDAELRGINGWVVTVFTFFSGTIAGTFIWLVLRPKVKPQPVTIN
ncbi:hypothetical protein [Pontibacter populi]|uniref:Cardiolipin synthase N-terminal domain-containing protein n=1 Tax=Pontibacter populi TaxID=890055 RepID=A0ABV1RUD7_9BACT